VTVAYLVFANGPLKPAESQYRVRVACGDIAIKQPVNVKEHLEDLLAVGKSENEEGGQNHGNGDVEVICFHD